MKILTTQNLMASTVSQSTNMRKSDEIRESVSNPLMEYSAGMRIRSNNIAFGKKNPLDGFKLLDKAAGKAKKKFGEWVANTKVFKKLFDSNSFGKTLEYVDKQEVMIQAITALAICCGLRPATIRALPGDKNKKDCDYAAAHSFSSGVWGFIVPFLFIKPLANAYNFVKNQDNIHLFIKNLDKLKERFPHINIDSLRGADGKIKPLEEGFDYLGNRIVTNLKDVQKVPLPKHLMTEASDATLKEVMPEIDLVLSKKLGKWVNKKGKEIMPDIKDLYFAVEKIGKNGQPVQQYFPFAGATPEVLQQVFPGLKLDSIYKKPSAVRKFAGKVFPKLNKPAELEHPTKWQFDNGFKIERKHLFTSNWNDVENSCIPLTTGFRKDGSRQCFLNNNNPDIKGSFGTPITEDMTKADRVNTVLDKLGGWLPDIVVAYPRASATVAIIPFVVKNVFGLEKSKKPAPAAEQKPSVDSVESKGRKVVA